MSKVLVHDGRSIPMHKEPKDPQAVLDYSIAFGDWLATGETISSATWVATVYDIDSTDSTASVTVEGKTYTAVHTVWLSGGTEGQTGVVTCRITTSAGRTEDRSFKLRCASK